jgi:hypothetical protein
MWYEFKQQDVVAYLLMFVLLTDGVKRTVTGVMLEFS